MEQNQSRDLPPEENTDRQAPLFPGGEADGAPGASSFRRRKLPGTQCRMVAVAGVQGAKPLA